MTRPHSRKASAAYVRRLAQKLHLAASSGPHCKTPPGLYEPFKLTSDRERVTCRRCLRAVRAMKALEIFKQNQETEVRD